MNPDTEILVENEDSPDPPVDDINTMRELVADLAPERYV